MWEVYLFIAGYVVQTTGSLVLLHKMHKTKSTYGLSAQTQILFLISTVSRCLWSRDTRLMDSPLAPVELMVTLVCNVATIVYFYRLRHTTTGLKGDGDLWWPLKWHYLTLTALLLAVVFHPGKLLISMQVMVALSIYCEAMALIPQLALMKRMVEVESLTSHFVALLVLARLTRLLFWVRLCYLGETFPGLMIADGLHTLLSVDYVYLWINKLGRGGPLLL
eukprot:GHVH01010697.1.p1 GENE.GHVH01010697.1~~GHVH01010697.1.p1  ORF type:complete len:221 (+),score=9.82 GHVH01010697.1:129-791(+)